jgi:phosphoribosylanthranilate isomerase
MNTHEGRPRPYVGVSGVVKQEHIEPSGLRWHEWQHQFLQAHANKIGLHDDGHVLALGVKATHKTQFLDEENKYGSDWYPVGEEGFAKAINPGLLNDDTMTVAQIYLEPSELHDPAYFHKFANKIQWRGQKWLQAMQFDMLPWDQDEDLFRTLDMTRRYFQTKILLQCHGPAMERLGPKGVAEQLGKHAYALDYVLFDASHGTGKRLDVAALKPFIEEAYSSEALRHVGIAVAGGLNADIVREDLPELLEEYPDLSFDVEGQVHKMKNDGTRSLNMDAAKDYLSAAVEVIRR